MVKSLKKGSERIFRDLLRATFSGLSKNVKVDKNLDLILCFVCGGLTFDFFCYIIYRASEAPNIFKKNRNKCRGRIYPTREVVQTYTGLINQTPTSLK